MNRMLIVLALICVVSGCSDSGPDPRVHAFYYPWYGTPELDGEYRHWAHDQMGAVDDRVTYPGGVDIGADFYPAGGCYSSNDPAVLTRHTEELRRAGVGSLCASWWGTGSFEDGAMPALLDAAADAGLEVSLHLEPLPGRDAALCRRELASYLDRFGGHPAVSRRDGRPVVFVYDSYLSPVEEWRRLLAPDGDLTIRGTALDCFVIGLWVESHHGAELRDAGFDGVYSYFATDGFTYGSTTANWPAMADFAAGADLTFVPCVGPGYADLRIRPWNTANQRDREQGDYYRRMAAAALAVDPDMVGLTSYNEWHEGTQIEPAEAGGTESFTYRDYGERGAEGYLDLTREWVRDFTSR